MKEFTGKDAIKKAFEESFLNTITRSGFEFEYSEVDSEGGDEEAVNAVCVYEFRTINLEESLKSFCLRKDITYTTEDHMVYEDDAENYIDFSYNGDDSAYLSIDGFKILTYNGNIQQAKEMGVSLATSINKFFNEICKQ